jgi:hypothetical protein
MPTISVRVSDAQKFELEERSARYSGNVSDYIKDALFGSRNEQANEILSRLDELTDYVSRLSNGSLGGRETQVADRSSTMLMEVLILLRMALPPDKIRGARAELDRLDIPSWEPNQERAHG